MIDYTENGDGKKRVYPVDPVGESAVINLLVLDWMEIEVAETSAPRSMIDTIVWRSGSLTARLRSGLKTVSTFSYGPREKGGCLDRSHDRRSPSGYLVRRRVGGNCRDFRPVVRAIGTHVIAEGL